MGIQTSFETRRLSPWPTLKNLLLTKLPLRSPRVDSPPKKKKKTLLLLEAPLKSSSLASGPSMISKSATFLLLITLPARETMPLIFLTQQEDTKRSDSARHHALLWSVLHAA